MNSLKKFSVWLIPPLLTLAVFALFFQLWKVDFRIPFFVYEGDALFTFFGVKNVLDTGWFFSNELLGWPHIDGKFYFHDFPSHADSFNFLVIKFLTFFSSDVFLITNLFFLLTLVAVSVSSFAVLRHLGISLFGATIVSVLYALTPYHMARGIGHLFLSNYLVVPLIVMIALWIAQNRIQLTAFNNKQCLCLIPNRNFYIAAALCLLIASNGVYHALYACLIFVFAWFIYSLKSGRFISNNGFAAAVLCITIIACLIILYIPSFTYWMEHGTNAHAANRDPAESEYFALRVVNLLLPVTNHHIDYFRDLRLLFDEIIPGGERVSESLGILAGGGFVFLVLWLIAKNHDAENSFLRRTVKKFSFTKKDQDLISDLAGLNLLTVLFSTAGGFIMLLVLPFPLLRSHARFSIFIAFFSLIIIAMIFDRMKESKKLKGRILIILIAIIALFDQVGEVSASYTQSDSRKEKFFSDREFVQNIEQRMPEGAAIFMAPPFPFPEYLTYDLLVGYVHSKKLRWSYPAMRGRQSSAWQQKMMTKDFPDFISELKKAGFLGIYIDRMHLAKEYDWIEVRRFEARLKKIAKSPAITSRNGQLSFYEI